MRLRDVWYLLRASWSFILVLVIAALALGLAFSLVQKPVYSSTAQVFVSTGAASSVTDLSQGSSFTQQAAKGYAQVASTPIVLGRVASQLGLRQDGETLAKQVSATVPLDTSIIEIDVTSPTPASAAAIANATATNLASVVQSLSPSSESSSAVKVTLISPAMANTVPVSPRVGLNLALAAIVGLVIGIAVAVARSALDTRIRGLTDVRSLTNLPILGSLTKRKGTQAAPLVLLADPRSTSSESFRALRTNLRFLKGPGDGGQLLLVTSSVAGEGKTTTACNLAIALAEVGKRVLLVDADLRRPRVADVLQIVEATGLTDVLADEASFGDVSQTWGETSDLTVLAAGPVPPNPAELLASKRMSELLADWKQAFDVVIIDSPPLLPVTDAAILSSLGVGAIVVCAAGATRRPQLTAALESLDQAGGPALGLVVTMLPDRGNYAYSYAPSYYSAEGGEQGRVG